MILHMWSFELSQKDELNEAVKINSILYKESREFDHM